MKRAHLDIRLLKHMGREKAYLCAKLYSRLQKHHDQYEAMAQSKNKGCVSVSLTQICKMMGIKNRMKSRYLVMNLKKRLWISGLVAFDNSWGKNDRNKAGRFAFISRVKEVLQEWKNQRAERNLALIYSRGEIQPFTATFICSQWDRVWSPEVLSKLVIV